MLKLSDYSNLCGQTNKKRFSSNFALLLLFHLCNGIAVDDHYESSSTPSLLDYDGYGEGDARPDVSQFLYSPETDLSVDHINTTDSIEESERQMLLALLQKDMLAEQESEEQQNQEEDYLPNTQLIGQVCMTVEPYRSVLNELDRSRKKVPESTKSKFSVEKNAFFECSPLSNKEAEYYGLEDKFLGVWTLRRCPEQLQFDALQQKCVEEELVLSHDCTKALQMDDSSGGEAFLSPEEDSQPDSASTSLRRKPSKKKGRRYHWQHLAGCYAPCQNPGAVEQPVTGGNCTWLRAQLQPDFDSPKYFFQCASVHAGQPCGQWVRQICPPNTVFNPAAQLCVRQNTGLAKERQMTPPKLLPPPPLDGVHVPLLPPPPALPDYAPSTTLCPSNYVAVSQCGRPTDGAVYLSCPGRASCHEGTCCSRLGLDINIKIPLILDNQEPMCHGSSAYPVSPCSDGCTTGYVCQPGVGCCPTVGYNPYTDASAALLSSSLESLYRRQQYVPSMLVCPAVSALARKVRPIGRCMYNPGSGNGCPLGYYCMARLKGCCPRYSSAISNHRMLYSSSSSSSSASLPYDSSEVRISSTPSLCPSGSPFGPACSQQIPKCATGYSCFRGYCCPVGCPATLTPVGFCAPTPNVLSLAYYPSRLQLPTPCTPQSRCHSGVCCQPVVPSLPVCSNGKLAKIHCALDGPQLCSPGFECSNGGCCPIPYCPSGIQAIGRCSVAGSCSSIPGAKCFNGLCCPPFLCADGAAAVGVCTTGIANNCAAGNECWNGRCCPLPKCPHGAIALGRCVTAISPMLNPAVMRSPACSGGNICYNGLCCAVQPASSTVLCPATNLSPISMCAAIPPGTAIASPVCATGYECVKGVGCCSLPHCSPGVPAIARCSMAVPIAGALLSSPCASAGNICLKGLCCPPPTCSYTDQVPMSICGSGNSCPFGYFCDGHGCCPEPLPVCPNGGRAIQTCQRGVDCPAGYGCTAMGGCCQLRLDTSCSFNQYPVCQCSSNFACPNGALCNAGGTCCAPTPAASFYVPGSRCKRSVDCQGHDNQAAQCLQNTCVCTNGGYSNGASCVPSNPLLLTIARGGCDQYGQPCRYLLSQSRKKPLFSPVGNSTYTEPLWYNVAAERSCVEDAISFGEQDNLLEYDPDNTCLPNEKCIDNKCKMRLWPGEYGCSSDAQCAARCQNTYCEARTGDNSKHRLPQCQCTDAFLLYGRCFEQCPTGFHESGGHCTHDDEVAFWADSDAQTYLQNLLNEGQC